MKRLLLVSCLVLFAASSAAAEGKWITLANSKRADGATYSTAYLKRVAPGQPLANDTSIFSGGTAGISIQYYLAGIDRRTVQVYKTTHDLGSSRDQERLPILLALGDDDSALFRFIAFGTGAEYLLKIRPQRDGTFTITPVK